jgi:hypothetical protein
VYAKPTVHNLGFPPLGRLWRGAFLRRDRMRERSARPGLCLDRSLLLDRDAAHGDEKKETATAFWTRAHAYFAGLGSPSNGS